VEIKQREGNQVAENMNMQLFEDKRIRTAWDADRQEWFFSVVDVVEVLTEQPTHLGARRYWSVLKTRMRKESAESTTICSQLKMKAEDSKYYNTDVADTAQLLRIIQSIPSRKAEPFKLWLARVGRERIDETIDPELTIDRALETYLKKENLRDNMSTLELVLNMLAEATTTEISKTEQPETFEENRAVARRGGRIAGNTRKEIEADTGKPVITPQKAIDFSQILLDQAKKDEDGQDAV